MVNNSIPAKMVFKVTQGGGTGPVPMMTLLPSKMIEFNAGFNMNNNFIDNNEVLEYLSYDLNKTIIYIKIDNNFDIKGKISILQKQLKKHKRRKINISKLLNNNKLGTNKKNRFIEDNIKVAINISKFEKEIDGLYLFIKK